MTNYVGVWRRLEHFRIWITSREPGFKFSWPAVVTISNFIGVKLVNIIVLQYFVLLKLFHTRWRIIQKMQSNLKLYILGKRRLFIFVLSVFRSRGYICHLKIILGMQVIVFPPGRSNFMDFVLWLCSYALT